MAAIAAVTAILACGSARADYVPPFKGNDTGGIIAYSLYKDGADIKAMAVNHCASYGKSIRRADLEAWVDSRIALGSQEGDDA